MKKLTRAALLILVAYFSFLSLVDVHGLTFQGWQVEDSGGQYSISARAKNTGVYGNANQVRVGLPEVYNCGATRTYVDCAVGSRSYIGPE